MTGAIIRSVVATEITNAEVGRAAFSCCRTLCSSVSPRRWRCQLRAWVCPGEAGWAPEELADHVREEYSTLSWLLQPAGLAVEEVSHSQSQIYPAYGCRRP